MTKKIHGQFSNFLKMLKLVEIGTTLLLNRSGNTSTKWPRKYSRTVLQHNVENCEIRTGSSAQPLYVHLLKWNSVDSSQLIMLKLVKLGLFFCYICSRFLYSYVGKEFTDIGVGSFSALLIHLLKCRGKEFAVVNNLRWATCTEVKPCTDKLKCCDRSKVFCWWYHWLSMSSLRCRNCNNSIILMSRAR
jgi:hypothetical protein